MELEKILFNRYNTGKLRFISRLDFLNFLALRNLKLLKNKNKKEIKEHIDMLEEMQDMCAIPELGGFLFCCSLQLRSYFNIGINVDREKFLGSFKKSLEKENLEEYISEIEEMV